MPQIIVKADRRDLQGDGPVMLKERVNVSDFESEHFAAQLVERLGWAVGDALEVEEQAADEEHAPRNQEASEAEESRAGRQPVRVG